MKAALRQPYPYFPFPSAGTQTNINSPVLDSARVRTGNKAQRWSTQHVSTRAKPTTIRARVALPFSEQISQNRILRNVDNVIPAGRGVSTRVVTRVSAQAVDGVSTSTEGGTHSTSNQHICSRIFQFYQSTKVRHHHFNTDLFLFSCHFFFVFFCFFLTQSLLFPPSHPAIGGF